MHWITILKNKKTSIDNGGFDIILGVTYAFDD